MEYQTAKAVKDTPILNRLIEQLEKATGGIIEGANRLDRASARLLNPEPQGIEKAQAEDTSPQTIEANLNRRVRALEAVGAHLRLIAERFDGAI